MSFNIDDLYSVSGGITPWGIWNPTVTKYGTSSFYNWEQDNLPLYDLEERTHFLWERLGYMPSSIPGMAIVVSGTIPTHLSTSSNVVTSIDDAIKLIPEIVRFPILTTEKGTTDGAMVGSFKQAKNVLITKKLIRNNTIFLPNFFCIANPIMINE